MVFPPFRNTPGEIGGRRFGVNAGRPVDPILDPTFGPPAARTAEPTADPARGDAMPVRGGADTPSGAADADIPLLTEVVRLAGDEAARPAGIAAADDRESHERQLLEDVLRRLLPASDALLGEQLQGVLAPVLERVNALVARELHDSLERLIRDIVARAVTDELARRRSMAAEDDRSSRRTR